KTYPPSPAFLHRPTVRVEPSSPCNRASNSVVKLWKLPVVQPLQLCRRALLLCLVQNLQSRHPPTHRHSPSFVVAYILNQRTLKRKREDRSFLKFYF
ncbi:hypothetical protein SESBI_17930, partial [Sesbania bispinosa]